MGLFGNRARDRGTTAPPPTPPATPDWSRLERIQAEWSQDDFDAEADLRAWREGMALYDARDDYAGLQQAGSLLCRALRHDLYGDGLLVFADLRETTHRVLFASCFSPPDGQSFPDEVAARARLGLAVTKKHGWQSREHGGDGTHGDYISHSFMILTTALAPPGQPWAGDLRGFFTSPSWSITGPSAVPQPPVSRQNQASADDAALVDDLYTSAQDADRGDPAGQARMRGLAASGAGDHTTALREFETAAQLGDVGAMQDAAQAARALGLHAQARHWTVAAAERDHGPAAFDLGIEAYNAGDLATAETWLEQAGENGFVEAFAALTQMADESGRRDREMHFSRLGADGGHPFCLLRQGQLLMQDHRQDAQAFYDLVLPRLSAAAEMGSDAAMFLIGVGYGSIGEQSNARLWLKRAESAGNSDATRVIREHGLA